MLKLFSANIIIVSKYQIFLKLDVQALIIVNHGGATQRDVLELVKQIKSEVKENFKIELEEEVNIL